MSDNAFDWSGEPAAGGPAPAPPAPGARRRRPGAPAAAGALALAAAIAAVVLAVSGGSGGQPATGAPLALAAAVTSHVPGYRVDVTLDVSAAGQDVALDAHGAFNTQPAAGSLTLSVGGTSV